MDLKNLLYFARVAEEGSIGQAASKVHRTQPAISVAISRLEQHLGHSLFDRTSSGMRLTQSGEIVYRHVTQLELDLEAMQSQLAFLADPNNGRIVICKGQTVSNSFVIDCINSIRSKYSGFKVKVLVGSFEDHISQLRSGAIDLLVSQIPEAKGDASIEHQKLFEDEFSVTCRADHPLCRKRKITLATLLEYPWLSGGPLDAVLPGWSKTFRKAGLEPPEPAIDTEGPMFVKNAIKSGDYLAMLPRQFSAEEVIEGSLAYLDVPELAWKQSKGITFLRRTVMPPSLGLMIETMQCHAARKNY